MPEFDSTVEYRPVPSLHPDFYRVSNDGEVWGCQKKGKGGGKPGNWRQCSPSAIGDGYLGVYLGMNGKRKSYYVHRLVLEAFVGPCPAGLEGCHNNGDRKDNRLGNLRWDTKKSNNADKILHGTIVRGERQWKAKLTESDVIEIRSRFASGQTSPVIAKSFGVNAGHVRSIVSRKTWRHVA